MKAQMVELINNFDPIAIWGAFLSTILAIVKIIEFWRTRRIIEISYYFTTNDDIGNEIIIRNLSPKPIIIVHWKLLLLHRNWFKLNKTKTIDYEESGIEFKLDPYTSKVLTFKKPYTFSWNEKSLGKNKIYIRLHLAGNSKSILKKVYG